MDLSLSEDQQLLKDSVSRFVEENYSIERLRALRDSEVALDMPRWRQLAIMFRWLSITPLGAG